MKELEKYSPYAVKETFFDSLPQSAIPFFTTLPIVIDEDKIDEHRKLLLKRLEVISGTLVSDY